MAVIAFFHNALGKTDGVSLEVDKWRHVLEKMGHTVLYCAGNSDVPGIHCIPELSFDEPLTNKILRNGTAELREYRGEAELLDDIDFQAGVLRNKLMEFIRRNRVEILIPNNLLSVGYNIPAVIALSEVIAETGLPTICHNHDFYYEESGEVSPTCDAVREIFERYIPPRFPNVRNVVINSLSRNALIARKGIESTIVPNVFDFDQPRWERDAYNADFRSAIGVDPDDIVLLQATRILNRKGVEHAIELAAELGKRRWTEKLYERPLYNGKRFALGNKIVLVCSGKVERFGITGDYHASLAQKAADLHVDLRFVGDIVAHVRTIRDGKKIYSLWDSYVYADFVTYPSVWEGWGNQFIEAVFAGLPVALFEYPVYSSDLKQAGFQVVSLGDKIAGRDKYGLLTLPEGMVKAAAGDMVDFLTDPVRRQRITKNNFSIGKRLYGYETLERLISSLLE